MTTKANNGDGDSVPTKSLQRSCLAKRLAVLMQGENLQICCKLCPEKCFQET